MPFSTLTSPALQRPTRQKNGHAQKVLDATPDAGFFSSALWAEYALRVHSLSYFVTNLIGVVFNGMQLSALFYLQRQARLRAVKMQKGAGASKGSLVEEGR